MSELPTVSCAVPALVCLRISALNHDVVVWAAIRLRAHLVSRCSLGSLAFLTLFFLPLLLVARWATVDGNSLPLVPLMDRSHEQYKVYSTEPIRCLEHCKEI